MSINLTKGASANLTKRSPNAKFTLTCSWSSDTDYDLYAIVLYRNGRTEHVALFNAVDPKKHKKVVIPAQIRTADGAVSHRGDIRQPDASNSPYRDTDAGISEEIIDVTLNDDILAVVPVAYSAQGNGTGSFRRYMVSMRVTGEDGQEIQVDASNASANETVYSCVPGVIKNGDGQVTVTNLELYSAPSSENRPEVSIRNGETDIVMDAGPRNEYKK